MLVTEECCCACCFIYRVLSCGCL